VRYLSVCSGIEAATVAWKPLGWEAAAFSEIEAFPRAVLKHHYPDVPLHGDFTTIGADEYGAIDLLVGGTPCQSFSVAGLRGGLADDRGNLALEFLRLAQRTRARWVVWENVPGVLSSAGGRDFGAILGGLVELGYGFAYRVLDAQHFGVPQRRRRVFVVGHLGDWRRAAAVLFERHSLSGNPPPRREAGEGVALSPTLRARANSSHRADSQAYVPAAFGGGNTSGPLDVAACLVGHPGRTDWETETFIAHSLRGEGFDAGEDDTRRGTPLVPVWSVTQDSTPVCIEEQSPALKIGTGLEMGQPPCIAFTCKDHGADAGDIAPTLRSMSHDASHANGGGQVAVAFAADVCPTLGRESYSPMKSSSGAALDFTIATTSAVRRLTPRECERLQGFPDDYTKIPWNGWRAMGEDETPEWCREQGMEVRQSKSGRWRVKDVDGPRYKALGNSMAVPCMRWIGERIAMVEALAQQAEAA
jgi:DNA (cytosine-5)-methyltransferase 1